MKRFALALFAPLALAGCALDGVTSVPTNPAAVADKTVMDERAALAVELAYKAAALGVEIAVDAGTLRGERAAQVARLEAHAYRAVLTARAAYDAGNATDYATALDNARSAVAAVLAAVKGN